MKKIKKRKDNLLKFYIIVILFVLLFGIINVSIREKWFNKYINLPKKAVKISGILKTKGTKIYDQRGREVIFRGINYDELTPLDYVYHPPDLRGLPEVCKRWVTPPTKLDAKQISQWGFNIVRLVLNWESLELQEPKMINGKIKHFWNEDMLKSLDKTISDLEEEQIAVILDMHQYLWSSAFKYLDTEDGWGCSGFGIPSWFYKNVSKTSFQKARCDFFLHQEKFDTPLTAQNSFLEVWRMIAKRYKEKVNVVAFDIINEPWAAGKYCTTEELHLDKFYLKVGEEIRKINPNILLIFEDSKEIDNTPLALSNPPPLDNIIYSFHLYTYKWEPKGKAIVDKFIDRARAWNVPLYLGEFNAFEWSSNEKIDKDQILMKENTEKLIKYLKKNNINWTFWSYSGFYSLLDLQSKTAKKDLLEVLQSGL